MVKRERTHAEETGKLSALELATGPLLTDRTCYLHRMHNYEFSKHSIARPRAMNLSNSLIVVCGISTAKRRVESRVTCAQ